MFAEGAPINLAKPFYNSAYGTYNQFRLLKCQQQPNTQFTENDHTRYQKEFAILTDKEPLDISKRRDAYVFFVKELTQDNPDLQQELLHKTQLFATTDKHYQALIGILINQGINGIHLFLSKINNLQQSMNLYTEFNKIFIENADNYQQFMTIEGLNNLDKLAALNDIQKAWWQMLIQQHYAAGNIVDFNELFNAYAYFLDDLSTIGLVNLPAACPFTPIKHMKTALDRGLYIIKNSINPEEQLTCLKNLDFSSNGAYLASRYNNFGMVASEMRLSPTVDIVPPYQFREIRPIYFKYISVIEWRCRSGTSSKFVDINYCSIKLNPNDPLNDEIYATFMTKQPELTSPGTQFVIYIYENLAYSTIYAILRYDTNYGTNNQIVSYNEKCKFYTCDRMHGIRPWSYDETILPVSNNSYYSQNGLLDYNPPKYTAFFHEMERMGEISCDLVSTCYYRFIGEQGSGYSFEVYQSIARMVLDEENPNLTPKNKARFLAIIALVSSGSAQSDNPTADSATLFKKMQQIAGNHGELFWKIIKPIFKMFSSESMPSFQVMTSIMEYIDFMLKLDAKTQPCIERLMSYASIYPADCLPALLNNIKYTAMKTEGIKEKLALIESNTEYVQFFISQRTKHGFKDPIDNANFVILLVLITGLDPLCAKAILLAKNINTMEPNILNLLLSILSTINPEKSTQLPSVDDLQNLITKIKQDLASGVTLNSRELLLNNIQTQLPKAVFGTAPIPESKVGLVTVFKEYFSNTEIVSMLNKQLKQMDIAIIEPMIPPNTPLRNTVITLIKNNLSSLGKQLTEVVAKLEKFIENINEEPPNIENIRKAFADLNSECCAILKFELKLGPLSMSLDDSIVLGIIQSFAGGDLTEQVKLLSKHKTILALLAKPIEQRYQKHLDTLIIKLQTMAPEFNNFLRQKLGEFSEYTLEALDAYSNNFANIQNFINGIISLKNKLTKDEYTSLIKLLNEKENYTLLSLEQLTKLINTYTKDTSVSMSQKLNIVFDVVRGNGVVSNKFDAAMQQLDDLAEFKDKFPGDLYKILLQISLEYNLTHDIPFPMAAITKFTALTSIDAEQYMALFDSLAAVLRRAPQNDNQQESITTIVSLIIQKIHDIATDHPIIMTLITNLLNKSLAESAQAFTLIVPLRQTCVI